MTGLINSCNSLSKILVIAEVPLRVVAAEVVLGEGGGGVTC